jgi:serine/threonine protein kinase
VSLVKVHDRQLGIRSICAAKKVIQRNKYYSGAINDQTSGEEAIENSGLISLKNELGIYERLQRHPNFPKLIGVVRDDQNFTIITEYVEGGDLRQFLHNKARKGMFIEQLVGDADYHEDSSSFRRYKVGSFRLT